MAKHVWLLIALVACAAAAFVFGPRLYGDERVIPFEKGKWKAARSGSDRDTLYAMREDLIRRLKADHPSRGEVLSQLCVPEIGSEGFYMRFDLGRHSPGLIPDRWWLSVEFDKNAHVSHAQAIPD